MDNGTIEYYNRNASLFINETQGVSMTDIHEAFLNRIVEAGPILDLGCGSGRDSKFFLDRGYDVVSVDGSVEMCKATEALTGKTAVCATFEDYETEVKFAGIWACASLLHLDIAGLKDILCKYSLMLHSGGCFYMSFKYGDFSGERDGRFFLDMDESALSNLISGIEHLCIESMMITSDVRPGRDNEKWLNCYCKCV